MTERNANTGQPPRDDDARMAEIAAATAGDFPRAASLASEAKAAGTASPLVHHVLAIKLQQDGEYEQAIVEAGLGLRLNPRDAGLTTTVGFCLLELGRRQEAAQVFGEALKLDPSSSEASYGYGWAAERLGALEAAESGFKRALNLDPGHADAMAGLSGLAARRRDWDEAQRYAEQAIAIDPGQMDALLNLARVDLGKSNFDTAIDRLRGIIALPALKPLARANARLMLGDALDGAKHYREAFDAYSEGKSELRELYAGEFARDGVPTAIDSLHRILAEFADTPRESWARATGAAPRGEHRGHAFLLGFPRSGTTLLEQVLETHPDVATLGERPVMIDAEAEFLTEPGGVKRLADVVSGLLEPYRQSYWRRVREFGIDPRGKVFVDKHPLGTIRLPLISKVFPHAKIIFAIRDPRDVVLSCVRRGFNMNSSMYEFTSLKRAANYYNAVMTAGEAYLESLPLDVLKVKYEDVVGDFDNFTGRLCDFLEIERTDGLREFSVTARNRMIGTPSSVQVGRGLYEEGVDQWRHYDFALSEVEPILSPWIERFGYSRS
jgi:Flp pilus assembly protein TadD